jgi:hypothetical protein
MESAENSTHQRCSPHLRASLSPMNSFVQSGKCTSAYFTFLRGSAIIGSTVSRQRA